MRWKIILPNLVVVLAVGFGGWLYLSRHLTEQLDRAARVKLERDRNLFVAVNQLNAVKLLRTAMARSRSAEVEAIFAEATDEEIASLRGSAASVGGEAAPATDEELHSILRLRAHRECQAFRANLSAESTTPELIAVTDRQGFVVSRDVDLNADPVGQNFGERFGSVRRALQGNAVRDIWYWNNFLLDVAISPIHSRGSVVGALIVGYDISNGIAQRDRDLFDADVAYLRSDEGRWRVHSSSIAAGARRTALVGEIERAQEALAASMADQDLASLLEISVGDESHIGLAGSLTTTDSAVPAGYVLLSSVRDVRAPAAQSIYVLFFAIGGALLVVVIGFVLGSHFLKPIEEIEEGILRIINGDTNHRFEIRSAEFGGLAYRVNQLAAVLTGEDEETEQESSST